MPYKKGRWRKFNLGRYAQPGRHDEVDSADEDEENVRGKLLAF